MTVIRPARPSDAPALAALINPIIAHGGLTAYRRPWDSCLAMEHLAVARVFLVAEDAEGPGGFQFVAPLAGEEGTGDIATFVALGRHGAGTGRALMAATLPLAPAAGFRVLNAEIRADNPGAQAYYTAMGFTEWARLTRRARDGTVMDKIIRRRVLATDPAER